MLIVLTVVVDYNRLAASIGRADTQLVLASLLIFSMQGIFESGRLKIVFADFGISALESVRLFFVGLFFSNFMPGMIGADLYQVHHMNSVRRGLLKPLSLSLFLRLTGLIINLLLALLALYFGTKNWGMEIHMHLPDLVFSSWMFVILFLIISSAVLTASFLGRDRLHIVLDNLLRVVRDFFRVVHSFSLFDNTTMGTLGISVILCRALSIYILIQAFGSSISWIDVVLVVTVTAIATLLPISFAGLGVREISATALLIAFGIAPPDAVAISFISRSFIWILSMIGGFWFVMGKRAADQSN